MDSDEFNNMFGGDSPDEAAILMEEMTRAVVPIYRGFVKNGLTVQEAAALTAAIVAQGLPQPPPKQSEE